MQHLIPIAGTTQHTVMCAQALLNDKRFTIPWILTPEPKLIGRKKILTKNPLHLFAEKNNIPVILVQKKIDEEIQSEVKRHNSQLTTQNKASTLHTPHSTFTSKNLEPETQNLKPNFLLVIDFGYIIPDWLLKFPTIAPVNIHPSELPKYRGSSPGQFVLLFGEQTSAVSVIQMNNTVDQGDIIYQEKFKVLNTWTSTEYYHHAFTLIAKHLPNILALQPLTLTPQIEQSPTPMARRLTKNDGYISWNLLQKIITTSAQEADSETSDLLNTAFQHTQSWEKTMEQAIKAFTPWPGVWTIVPTHKGEKRMKILSVEMRFIASEQRIILQDVQLEGLQPTTWNEVKNQIRGIGLNEMRK